MTDRWPSLSCYWPQSTLCTIYNVQNMVYSLPCRNCSLQSTVQNTDYILKFTVDSVQCKLYKHSTVYIVQCTVYIVQYKVYKTIYTVRCTVYSAQCAVQSVHCTLYTVQRTVMPPPTVSNCQGHQEQPWSQMSHWKPVVYTVQCNVQCTLYTLQCTGSTLQSQWNGVYCKAYPVQFTVYFVLYNLNFVQCKVQFTLYTVHFTAVSVLCTLSNLSTVKLVQCRASASERDAPCRQGLWQLCSWRVIIVPVIIVPVITVPLITVPLSWLFHLILFLSLGKQIPRILYPWNPPLYPYCYFRL